MWISRKHYNFLKENAEKNVNAECEILKVKEEQTRAVSRAMAEFSNTLEELDNYKKCCSDIYDKYYMILEVFKCTCETVDIILTETIKIENGEESATVSKFKNIENFARYMKCFNDTLMDYVKGKLEEDKK